MFAILNYYQGSMLIAAALLLACSCFQSSSANKDIEKAENELGITGKYWKQKLDRAPMFTIILAILILVSCIISPITPI